MVVFLDFGGPLAKVVRKTCKGMTYGFIMVERMYDAVVEMISAHDAYMICVDGVYMWWLPVERVLTHIGRTLGKLLRGLAPEVSTVLAPEASPGS